jgi:hypothetical protein
MKGANVKTRCIAAILMAAAIAVPQAPTISAAQAGHAARRATGHSAVAAGTYGTFVALRTSGVTAKAVSPIFRALLPALARTQVPLRLPANFPEAGGQRLYATLGTAKPGHYAVDVDYTADCHGANVCHYGDVEGRKIASTAKTAGSPVQLGHRISGYFVLGRCGGSCAESTITWNAGGFRYTVGAKISRADLIAFAASAAN